MGFNRNFVRFQFLPTIPLIEGQFRDGGICSSFVPVLINLVDSNITKIKENFPILDHVVGFGFTHFKQAVIYPKISQFVLFHDRYMYGFCALR